MRTTGKLRITMLAAIALALLCLPLGIFAQPKPAAAPKAAKVDLGSFLDEMMIAKIAGDQYEVATWFSFEYVVQILMAQGQDRATAVREANTFQGFQVIFVQTYMDTPVRLVYQTEAQVRLRACLLLPDGELITPLKPEELPKEMAKGIHGLKQSWGDDHGRSGQFTHVLVFPAYNKARKPVVDTHRRDKLTLVLRNDGTYKESRFTWRTPFDAVSPAPPCAKCKESVSGKWTFCPWCGEKLEQVDPIGHYGQTPERIAGTAPQATGDQIALWTSEFGG